MNRISIVLCVLVMAANMKLATSQDKPGEIRPAEKLEEGWDDIDQRLRDLVASLASTEVSLNAIEKEIFTNGLEKNKKTAQERIFDQKNIAMDRKGGGPVRWQEFYGTTADTFFYHPTGRGPTYHAMVILNPSNQVVPASNRPPQFDYIYRANDNAKALAQNDAAKLKGNIDKLVARRTRLESEQAGLWVKIAFWAVQHNDIDKKPLFRFEPIAARQQDADAMRAAIQFMVSAFSIIKKAEDHQDEVFKGIKTEISEARQALNDTWLRLEVDAKDKKSHEGYFAALAKHLDEVSSTLSETYVVALDGNKENDRVRKDKSRGMFQTALVSYAQTVLALDEMADLLKGDWNVTSDANKKLYGTAASENDKENSLRSLFGNKIRSQFKAQVSYDPKDGELKLSYDFNDTNQLNDFVIDKDGNAKIEDGKLKLSALTCIKNKVDFSAVKVTAEFEPVAKLKSTNLMHLDFTSVMYHTDAKRKDLSLDIWSNGKIVKSTNFPRVFPLRVGYEVFHTKVILYPDSKGNGIAVKKLKPGPAGQVEFLGNTEGLAVSNLVIQGVPKDEWCGDFVNRKK